MEFRQTCCIPPPQQQHFQSPTIPPPSHLFTDATLPIHCSSVLSDFNYWVLKLVTGVKCSLLTDFIGRYQYRVISSGLKQPVTDRALISNGLYKPVTDRFNICNGLFYHPLQRIYVTGV
jgi:hypothetical protein